MESRSEVPSTPLAQRLAAVANATRAGRSCMGEQGKGSAFGARCRSNGCGLSVREGSAQGSAAVTTFAASASTPQLSSHSLAGQRAGELAGRLWNSRVTASLSGQRLAAKVLVAAAWQRDTVKRWMEALRKVGVSKRYAALALSTRCKACPGHRELSCNRVRVLEAPAQGGCGRRGCRRPESKGAGHVAKIRG